MSIYSKGEILIWLNSINITNAVIEKLVDYIFDIRELVDIDAKSLFSIPGIKAEYIQRIVSSRDSSEIDKILDTIKNKDINTITIYDEDYPLSLNNVYSKPPVIYYKGEFQKEDQLAIALVGSRKATSYGKWACEKFTKELVNMGVTIVSGLALGIDTIAHKTALENDGRTIAVLGSGIDIVYPKNNMKLYDEISQKALIMSEFPIGTQPLAYNFPQRNRIISGLSKAVIVIEAKEKSGSLITAHHALEQGKDVFSLPGNINNIYSGGTNKLIKDGAIPLLDIDDILEGVQELKDKYNSDKITNMDYSSLSDTEIRIVNLLKDGPIRSDMIIYKTGLNISTVISTLRILELKGVIKELNSRMYSIS